MWMAAERLVGEVDRWMPRVRRHAANSASHLERSAEAVLYNIAEGVGAYPPKVKIAAYEVAKKEASEVRGILRRLVILRLLTSAQIQPAYDLAGAIVGMLTAAIKTLQQRIP
jgi:four helix bundle protein